MRVEEGFTSPAGARVVDLRSKTVLPGLIDAHVHLTGDPGTPFWREPIDTDELSTIVGVKNALITARAGFTTVRDLGSAQFTAFALRDAINKGLVPGPRIVAAGQAISIIGGHGVRMFDSQPGVTLELLEARTWHGSGNVLIRYGVSKK